MELLQKEKGKIQQERADLLTDLEALGGHLPVTVIAHSESPPS